jgi:hypothetical protein
VFILSSHLTVPISEFAQQLSNFVPHLEKHSCLSIRHLSSQLGLFGGAGKPSVGLMIAIITNIK